MGDSERREFARLAGNGDIAAAERLVALLKREQAWLSQDTENGHKTSPIGSVCAKRRDMTEKLGFTFVIESLDRYERFLNTMSEPKRRKGST